MHPAERIIQSGLRATIAGVISVGMFVCAHGAASDFLLDESQRNPTDAELDPAAERKAEAMARFITGMFTEEMAGPEQALESFRRVLVLDPEFTKLAIDVAYDYLRRNDATEAIGVLKDAIKAKPGDPDACLALSSIYLRHLRKPDLARKYAEEALEAEPGSFAPYEALWEIAQAEGDPDGAIAVLDRAAKVDSDDFEFWLKLAEFYSSSTEGRVFVDEKTAEKVNASLTKALDLGGEDPDAMARVADYYIFHDQFDRAIPLYTEAIEARPRDAKLLEKLSTCYLIKSDFEGALPVLEKLIEVDSLNLPSYDRLAAIYTERGDLQRAIAAIEQALIIDKSNWQRFEHLAKLQMVLGQFDQAAERLGEARELFPHLVLFTMLEARAQSLAGDHDAAMSLFERSLIEASASQPELLDSEFYVSYGIAAEQAGRFTKAEELLKKAIDLDPTHGANAFNALGYMWVDRNENLEEAEKLIRRALELDPNNGAFIDSLGWLHYRKGEYESAVRELLRALDHLPESDPVVLDHLGDAYRAMNKNSEALLYWQKALQLDPENQEIVSKIDAISEQVVRTPGGNSEP